MKLRLSESYGFAGTDSTWEEDIPEEIVAKGQQAIEAYLDEYFEGHWDNMLNRLSLSIEVIE